MVFCKIIVDVFVDSVWFSDIYNAFGVLHVMLLCHTHTKHVLVLQKDILTFTLFSGNVESNSYSELHNIELILITLTIKGFEWFKMASNEVIITTVNREAIKLTLQCNILLIIILIC